LKRRLSIFKVARPLVRLQQLQRVLADATDTLARPLGKPMSEVLHEEGDIQAALAQRRQLQREHVQSVEQVGAERLIGALSIVIGS